MREDGERDVTDETRPAGRHTPPVVAAQPEILTPLLRDRESVMVYDRSHVLGSTVLPPCPRRSTATAWNPFSANQGPTRFHDLQSEIAPCTSRATGSWGDPHV